MGFDEGQIILNSDTGTYYPGQMLYGRLEFDLNKDKKFRGIYAEIKGKCKVHWTTNHSRRVNDRTEHYTVTHESYEEYMNVCIYLIGSKSGEHTLHPGHHVFPFECQIPPHCPSSFEGSKGSIRYQVKVTVDRSFKMDQTKRAEFRVEAPLDLNANPYCKEPIAFQLEQTFCCWCMNSGGAETIIKLPAGGFCPKQVVPVEVACTNTSSVEIDAIRFSIKKTITFKAEREPDTRQEDEKVLEMKKGPVPGHTERHWTVEMEIPDMETLNLNTCRFIDIDYEFKVKIETSGCHADDEDSAVIFIGSIPVASLQYPPNSNFENVQTTQGVTSYPAPPVVNQPLLNYPPGAYPGANPPYPGANPPYPANPSVGFKPPENPPYPTPYPVSPNMTGNPPYPGGNPPYPGGNPPYPGGNSPYPGGNPPYPSSNPPYVTAANVQSAAPYPMENGRSPFPDASNQQPFPGQNPTPYPTSPNVGTNFPSTNSPYPSTAPAPYTPTGLKTGNIGFPGTNEPSVGMPFLPPGALTLPASPYAAASAPAPSTPDDENKKPGDNMPPYPQ